MNERAINHLENELEQGEFSFGETFSYGWDIWKSNLLVLIGIMIIFMVISVVMGFIPYGGSQLAGILINPALMCGTYIFCANATKGRGEFSNLFDGFSKWKELVFLTLISYVIYIVCAVPFIYSLGIDNLSVLASGDPLVIRQSIPEFDVYNLLLLLPMIIVGLLMSLSVPMLYFYDLGPIDALKYSARFIMNHFFMFLLFFFVVILVGCSGMILLFIGIIITIPIIFTMSFAAFSKMTNLEGYNSEEGQQDLSQHIVES